MNARQKDLVALVQWILRNYPIGTELQGEHLQFVLDLLKNHQGFQPKNGSRIRIVSNPWKVPGFAVVGDNGEEQEFSYKRCLRPLTELEELSQAMRNVIDDQVFLFRKLCWNLGWTGDFDIHHDPSFSDLRDRWLGLNPNLDVSVTYENKKRTLASREAVRSWSAFHQQNARLFAVTKTDHEELHK